MNTIPSVDSFGYRRLGNCFGCVIIQPKLQSDNMMLRMGYIAFECLVLSRFDDIKIDIF